MPAAAHLSALASLIQNSPLENPTSIELLKIGHSASGATAPVFHATVGDDIVSHIATGGTARDVPRGEGAAAQIGIDTPELQILQVISSLCKPTIDEY
jgi:hypothetical protein